MDTAGSSDRNRPLKGAPKKEAFHRDAESRMMPFGYKRPDVEIEGRRAFVYLCHSDLLKAQVQIVPEGGDSDLHYHPGFDGFWMVLQGRVRFHGPDGAIGEYGKGEGILMPRNARYWFETADTSEELQLLHISVNNQQPVKNGFIAVNGRRPREQKDLRLNFPAGL